MRTISPRCLGWDCLSFSLKIGIIITSVLLFCLILFILTFFVMYHQGQQIRLRKTPMAIMPSHHLSAAYIQPTNSSQLNSCYHHGLIPMVSLNNNTLPKPLTYHQAHLPFKRGERPLGVIPDQLTNRVEVRKQGTSSKQLQYTPLPIYKHTASKYTGRHGQTSQARPDSVLVSSSPKTNSVGVEMKSSDINSSLDSELISSTGATVHTDDFLA